jgi:hypothetical protein
LNIGKTTEETLEWNMAAKKLEKKGKNFDSPPNDSMRQ